MLAYTQYGKSEIVSMAVLTRVSTFAEKWVIIGGSKDKAEIIMDKLTEHVFDNKYTKEKLSLKNIGSLERLRHEKSKEKLTFNIGEKEGESRIGQVSILSADAKKKGQDAGDILVGHGAQNIIVDDAPLLNDTINGKMMRMLGGYKDYFLMKIGNAIKDNHFKRAYFSDRYVPIKIDYKVGIEEGRQSAEYFEWMKEEMDNQIMFDSFYGCEFPPQDSAFDGVWMPLLTNSDIDKAMEESDEVEHFGIKRKGVDVADTGVDHDVICMRSPAKAEILYDTQKSDQMKLASAITNCGNDEKAFVDKIGVGAGVCSRLREIGYPHVGVHFGEKPSDTMMFSNKKAEMYWQLRKWIHNGGKLKKDQRWYQLTNVMYRAKDRTGKIEIMPKRIASNLGIKSPDVADALAATFYYPDRYNEKKDEDEEYFYKRMKEKKKRKRKKSEYNLKMI